MRNTVDILLERVIVLPSGCWRYPGWVSTKGYVRITIDGRSQPLHRVLYEDLFGYLPFDMTLDHTCRNRWCCNPWHCDPVTNHVNILRGIVPSANRVLCKNGLHDITAPGAIYVDSQGSERCHECVLETKRRYRLRKAA